MVDWEGVRQKYRIMGKLVFKEGDNEEKVICSFEKRWLEKQNNNFERRMTWKLKEDRFFFEEEIVNYIKCYSKVWKWFIKYLRDQIIFEIVKI